MDNFKIYLMLIRYIYRLQVSQFISTAKKDMRSTKHKLIALIMAFDGKLCYTDK